MKPESLARRELLADDSGHLVRAIARSLAGQVHDQASLIDVMLPPPEPTTVDMKPFDVGSPERWRRCCWCLTMRRTGSLRPSGGREWLCPRGMKALGTRRPSTTVPANQGRRGDRQPRRPSPRRGFALPAERFLRRARSGIEAPWCSSAGGLEPAAAEHRRRVSETKPETRMAARGVTRTPGTACR